VNFPQINEKIEPNTLYIVATPIGNLNDITLRALYILENVDLIACEDTRRTALLLKHYGLEKPLISFHSHSSPKKFEEIKERLKTETIALVSDAGTPCISDPGAKLAAYLLEEEMALIPIPGPAAVITAISASGLDTREFTFRGFLGKKGLQSKVKEILMYKEIQVVYESPQRLLDLLAIIKTLAPRRRLVVAREITKLHEEFFRGSATEGYDYFRTKEIKGELTLIIAGNDNNNDCNEAEIRLELQKALNEGRSLRETAKELSLKYGVAKNLIYDIGLKLKP